FPPRRSSDLFARPRWLIPHHLRATSPVSRRGVDDADTEERAMTDTAGEAAEALRGRMTGPVITPDDRSYDDARRLWNGDADGRPAVIACCMSRDDVAAAVDVAQANGLEISVRGGAHSFSGASAGDDGLMIHLGAM